MCLPFIHPSSAQLISFASERLYIVLVDENRGFDIPSSGLAVRGSRQIDRANKDVLPLFRATPQPIHLGMHETIGLSRIALTRTLHDHLPLDHELTASRIRR